MILVDTSVLVYVSGAGHPLRAPCRMAMKAVSDGRTEGSTTVEVIQEFVWVSSARRDRGEATARARQFQLILSPLLRTEEEDLAAGLVLFESIPAIGSFDAVLAAAALRVEATLVSADRSFAEVPGLRHLDPASPTFADDLTRA